MPKTKLVPLTAANLTNDIVNRLNADGHCANRVNNTGIWDKRGFYRKQKNGEKGKSDIIVCLEPLGWYAAIEIKIDEDVQSIYQKIYEKRVTAAGGRYVQVKTQNDFFEWYKQITDLIKYVNDATQGL